MKTEQEIQHRNDSKLWIDDPTRSVEERLAYNKGYFSAIKWVLEEAEVSE